MSRFDRENCLLRRIPTALARRHVQRTDHTVVRRDV